MTDTPLAPGWLTVKQAAEASGYSVAHLRRLLEHDQLEGVRLEGQVWLVKLSSLEAYQARMAELGPGKHDPWRERRPDLPEGRGRRKPNSEEES